MRAILIGPVVEAGGSFLKKQVASLKRGPDDLVIAVDGGLQACRAIRLVPDIAIGDWDSIPNQRSLARTPHLTLRQNKDRSDLYYACQTAVSLGASELICLGVTGGRPDHQLAMLMDLSWIEARTRGVRSMTVLSREARYFFVSRRHSPLELELKPGQTVSVFALGGPAHGVTLKGFKYRLHDAELKPSSHGLSNEVTQRLCSVGVERGRLVVMALSGASGKF